MLNAKGTLNIGQYFRYMLNLISRINKPVLGAIAASTKIRKFGIVK